MAQPSYSWLVTSKDDFWSYLDLGQHYAIKRDRIPFISSLVYYHHFIISSYCERSLLRVIHYAPPEQVLDSGLRAKKRGIIRQADYFTEIMRAIREKNLYIIERPEYEQVSVEDSLMRAISRLGETKYSVELNNCEHFVSWCKSGVHRSEQCSRASGARRSLIQLADAPLEGCDKRGILDFTNTKLNGWYHPGKPAAR